jgi:pyruvate/2-oxoglutarate/acetoin dehydrogenase E1 component
VCRAETKTEMLMWEALRKATDEEMERDPTVCVMGAAILFTQALPWLQLQ